MVMCPHCGVNIPTVGAVDATRRPGYEDIILCTKCLNWSVVDMDGRLAKPNAMQREVIAVDPRCAALVTRLKPNGKEPAWPS
jgi:hypothetical protein